MQEILNGQTVLVCAGGTDLYQQVVRTLAPHNTCVLPLDGLPELMRDKWNGRGLVVISASAVHPDDAALVLQRLQDRPVLWIDQAPGAPAWITPRQPTHLLPFDFRDADLCRMLTRMAHRLTLQLPPASRRGHARGLGELNLLRADSGPPALPGTRHPTGPQPTTDRRTQLQI